MNYRADIKLQEVNTGLEENCVWHSFPQVSQNPPQPLWKVGMTYYLAKINGYDWMVHLKPRGQFCLSNITHPPCHKDLDQSISVLSAVY